MTEAFLDHWRLFQHFYLSGCLSAAVLALVGVFVVARDQIFLGAAVSQASTLGIALALALGSWVGGAAPDWFDSEAMATPLAVIFSMGAALSTCGVRQRTETQAALTGWVFLAASSFSILLASFNPHGLEEIHDLLFSTIIAATSADTWSFGALVLISATAVYFLHPRLILLTMDPVQASALGMRLGLWTLASYAWLGLVIGLALETTGLLYTFGCLVLPPLIAKNLVREVRPMLILAPVIALVGSSVGLVLAHPLDVPPAQLAVAILSALLAVAWMLQRRR